MTPEKNKKPKFHDFLGVSVPARASVIPNDLVRSIIHALEQALPLIKGNGDELMRALHSRGVTPDAMRAAHKAMAQIRHNSVLRTEFAETLKPHRERLWNAFLNSLPSTQRARYEIPQNPIRTGRLRRKSDRLLPKFPPGDDRKSR